jgi:hypothetical protein
VTRVESYLISIKDQNDYDESTENKWRGMRGWPGQVPHSNEPTPRVLVYMVVVSVQLLRANDIWATSGRVASSDA